MTVDTKPLPYLPYPRFLLGADLTQTAKVLYAVLLDRSNLSRANGWTDEDGILCCGKCRTPKQFRMEAPPMEGRLLPHPCCCEQERLDREIAEQEARCHRQAVADLKRRGFTDPAMKDWTFANDNGKCPLCWLHRQCSDGAGGGRPHGELCPDTERPDRQL